MLSNFEGDIYIEGNLILSPFRPLVLLKDHPSNPSISGSTLSKVFFGLVMWSLS